MFKRLSVFFTVLLIVSSSFALDNLVPYPRFIAWDAGAAVPGAYLYTYETGTTTPKATKKSQGGSANANPIVMDSNGEADVWCDGVYRFQLRLADDSTVVWTKDDINNKTLASEPLFLIEHTSAGRHFAPDSSSYTDFATALATIGGTETTLIVSTAEAVSADDTVPATLELLFREGGKLTIASGITLTVSGTITAGHFEIIDGPGTVTGTTLNSYLDSIWTDSATTDTMTITADSSTLTTQAQDVASLSIAGTAVTATATELNLLDGVTATTDELNTSSDGISNPPIAGDSTAGRVLRKATLLIEDGTDADTIKVTLTAGFNGDTIAATDNVALGVTTGNFSLSATTLSILSTGITGNCVGVLPANISGVDNAAGFNFVEVGNSGNDITVKFRNQGTAIGISLQINNQFAGAEYVQIEIAYITDA